MNEDALQTLVDKSEIVDLFNRYATSIDTRDRALYRSCFTEALTWDMMGQGLVEGRADDWVDSALTTVNLFKATQHIITNHTISLAGDSGSAVAYLQAQHWNEDAATLVGGYYSNKLIRSPDGWKICHLELAITWTQNS
jgi:hypothetical protein